MNIVLKAFMDKTDGTVYYAGDLYDGERTEELIELGHVQQTSFHFRRLRNLAF